MSNDTCPICNAGVDYMTQESFVIEYLLPEGHANSARQAVFFHPNCFISLAGSEWARRCGMKIEKATEPIRSSLMPIATDVSMPMDNFSFEYRDIKFKASPNVRVYCQNIDGKQYYSVEKLEKK